MAVKPPALLRLLLFCLVLIASVHAPVFGAQNIAERYPVAREFFPAADRFGALEGEPPAAAVWGRGKLLGYVFQTYDVIRIPAYSGKPINTLVGLDTGVRIVYHEEPILVVGITDKELRAFTDQYVGKSAHDRITVGAPRAPWPSRAACGWPRARKICR